MLSNTVVKNAGKLALLLIIGLALLISLPAAVQAQDPVDLQLGGDGATSWNIGNIKPGDSGTKTVTLHNAGYEDGLVTIWISDIVNSEGTNPESETGNITEPGELSDYLVLNLSCNGLRTNLSLPAIVNDLPQSASGPDYIKVSPLNAGDTVNLDWEWELPLQTDNEVQGDSLSFTINYLLEELPPPPPPPPAGGGDGGASIGDASTTHFLEIDILGEKDVVEIGADGTLRESLTVADSGGNFIIEIDSGTKVTCSNGIGLSRLELTLIEESLVVPDDMVVLSPIYKLTGYTQCMEGYRVNFDPPARLTISYALGDLAENALSVFIGCYTDEQGLTQLEPPSGYAVEIGKAKAEISHVSLLVAMTKLVPSSPPLPAKFKFSNFAINPSQAQPDQSVTVSLIVTNSGGTIGSHELQLKIDGIIRAAREITLASKSGETVKFEVSNLAVGEHQIEVAGLTGQLSVVISPSSPAESTINWLCLGLSIGAAVVIGLLVLYLVRRRPRPAIIRRLKLW